MNLYLEQVAFTLTIRTQDLPPLLKFVGDFKGYVETG